MDIFIIITEVLQVLIVGFTIVMTVKRIQNTGYSIILIFFAFAMFCLVLGDLYWVALETINPDTRVPTSVDEIGEIGTALLLSSILSIALKELHTKRAFVTIITILYTVVTAFLWTAWGAEWTKNIISGTYFGYFILATVIACKKTKAFKKITSVIMGCILYIVAALEVIALYVPEEVFDTFDLTCEFIMFSLVAVVMVRTCMFLWATRKKNTLEASQKALAITAFLIFLCQNTMYISGDPFFGIADNLCSIAYLLMFFAVLLYENIRIQEGIKVPTLRGGKAI